MTISSFNSLPQDLVIELCMHVVSTSSTPHEDLRSLRASCSRFFAASKEKIIGRRMPVKKMDGFRWSDIKNYLAFLKYCAESGNLEASYLLGLQEMYTSKDKKIKNSGLNHLLNAMEGGHKASTYVAGIILFKKPETRSLGTRILNKLAALGLSESSSSSTAPESESVMSGGNLLIQTCRREAAATIRDISWKRWHLRSRSPTCANRACGCVVKDHVVIDRWAGDDERRRFCSSRCKWMNELYEFCQLV
ncbi:hypothetical protein Cni_G04084 [Canna indica]|uniref:At2g35280-like TPR domain-containing protein n=1 Tax=Canna indica TaxID=4628 RepID=A0AAQ3Q462_9LILI|nr:hypothetical protein Cni_G04084 [Canna indica]